MIVCTLRERSETEVGGWHVRHLSGETIAFGDAGWEEGGAGLSALRIFRQADQALMVEIAAGAAVSIDGVPVGGIILLAVGMRIELAAFKLVVLALQTDESDLLLERSLTLPAEPVMPVSIQRVRLSKRRLALGSSLVLLLVVGFLLWIRFWGAAVWPPTAGVLAWLSPGQIARGHQVSGVPCTACHEAPLAGVSNERCTKCHSQMRVHALSEAEMPDAARCTDCHAGHAGRAASLADTQKPCVRCHQRTDVVSTSVGEARDFTRHHPAFHAYAQGEQPHLKFSHKKHLVQEGVSSPLGNTVLTCQSCHQPTPEGGRFEAVDMEKSCQQSRCHKIRLAEPVLGSVKHGSALLVMQRLREFFLQDLVDNPDEVRRRCADLGSKGGLLASTLACSEQLARRQAGDSVFQTTGGALQCALCHEINTSDEGRLPWQIVPVKPYRGNVPRTVFNHEKHRATACTTCHDKQSSERATDLNMPGIAKCRECHSAGTTVTEGGGRRLDECQLCHRFHRSPPDAAASGDGGGKIPPLPAR